MGSVAVEVFGPDLDGGVPVRITCPLSLSQLHLDRIRWWSGRSCHSPAIRRYARAIPYVSEPFFAGII